MKILFLSLLFLISLAQLRAQKPTIQDCLGAIPICTEIYEEKNAPSGSGNYTNEINGSNDGGICCMDDERNSIWYTFTVNKMGNFGFVLTPNDPFDDYDWALFDITNATCEDIYNDITLQVSCNAAGGGSCNGITGADGKSNYANQGGGCDFLPPDVNSGFSAHNALIPVENGNTYVLVVSNWTGSTNGYKIDFSPSGDLGIFDDQAPFISDIAPPEDCDVDSMKLVFSENIQLNSISGENFILHGPKMEHQVVVSSVALSVQGDYDKCFQLSFFPSIADPGDYRLQIVADGVTDIRDLCGNPIQNPESISFSIGKTQLAPPLAIQDTVLCVGESLNLDISNPLALAYMWQDSSDLPTFTVSKSGKYLARVLGDCGWAESDFNVAFANCDSCNVFIPNAFSPNGDGINDILEVFSDCELQQFSISIYNRWGSLIHQSNLQSSCWDGKIGDSKMQSDNYVYILKYQVQELGDLFFRELSGGFTVIR